MDDVVALGSWAGQDWMAKAACAGKTRLFFAPLAERPQARARREAKAAELCRACPSRTACRDFARERREFGYWGGENEEERTRAGFPVPNPVGARRRAAS
ncbi:MAG TPA: WhiB family transcriptional regulator [Acidimicrobiales bacterium]|nr:WhiB family transcriptional regulator [Acidimicrobiales bacterium]